MERGRDRWVGTGGEEERRVTVWARENKVMKQRSGEVEKVVESRNLFLKMKNWRAL
jgi:hypothetical protein